MFNYHKFDEINIRNLNKSEIEDYYNKGYKLTRINLQSTRLIRVNLKDFSLSSENKRILNKYPNVKVELYKLPYLNYNWKISKLGHDFYQKKFGEKLFSVNKLKSLFLNPEMNSMNSVLVYSEKTNIGFCLCFNTLNIFHYSYPFYEIKYENSNFGMFMMTSAVKYSKENGYKYIYLGGCNSKKDLYKNQFNGIEWWTGENWSKDLALLKSLFN